MVYVQDGLPMESRSITIEKAVVKWIKEIQREAEILFQYPLYISRQGRCTARFLHQPLVQFALPGAYAELICGMLRERMQSLELELAERGYSMDYLNIIYVGGADSSISLWYSSQSDLSSILKRMKIDFWFSATMRPSSPLSAWQGTGLRLNLMTVEMQQALPGGVPVAFVL